MSNYRHTKGQINDNAIEALLHDPLFRQRIEKKVKGKGSYQRKCKHKNVGKGNWEASGKNECFLPLAFWFQEATNFLLKTRADYSGQPTS